MAGLHVITDADGDARERLARCAAGLRYGDEAEVLHCDRVGFAWLGFDRPEQFAPAVDRHTGSWLAAAGRVSWPGEALLRAEGDSIEGGRHTGYLLQRFLGGGPGAITGFSGAALICLYDKPADTLHCWTDPFGYHPAFLYRRADDGSPQAVTTHPDVLWHDPATPLEWDDVSAVEMLRAWRVTPPHTYYRQVKHLGAAAHVWWKPGQPSVQQQTYWQPRFDALHRSLGEASEDIAEAVGSAIAQRTREAGGTTALLVSGGADSRVMLYAADDPKQLVGINLYEFPSDEARIAQQLCQRSGATYVGFGRDADYYPRLMAESVRWSGGMWCLEDNHYTGVGHLIRQAQSQLVMTACTTDWLFKGYGLEKRAKTLMGRQLPTKAFVDHRVDGFLPNVPTAAAPRWSAAVDQRMQDWFAGTPSTLHSAQDRLQVEDRRIRPACYTVSVSGPIMYRIYPFDTFMADPRVAAAYERTPPEMKLNGDAWGRAAARICQQAADIVDANFGWRTNASQTGKLIRFGRGWVRRKLLSRLGRAQAQAASDHPPPAGSWPQMQWYIANSPTLRRFWDQVPGEDRDRMNHLLDADMFAVPLDQWRGDANHFFRAATLLAHWQSVRERRGMPCASAS